MAIKKQKKEEIVKKLSEVVKEAESVAFANFHGLSMVETTELRKKLRENGVKYYVAKKSLIRRVFGDASLKGEIPELQGEIAIAWSKDSLAPSREIFGFAKTHEGSLALVGGVYEREFRRREFMAEIAQIPSIDVLRGMFVNIVNSPIQRFAIALSEVAKAKA